MRPRFALLLLVLVLPWGGAPQADEAGASTYLILPFENVAEDPSLRWLSTGLAYSLGEYMQGLGEKVVDDEERAVLYEGSGLPAGAPLMLASALELGRRMRARPGSPRPDRLVLGRFLVMDGDLTISARSIDLAREKALPWVSRQGRLKDLLKVLHKAALSLASADGLEIPESRSTIFKKHAEDLPLLAYETYCRAMAESDAKKRLQLLRRATRESPGYPKAVYHAAAILVRSERWNEAATMIANASSDPHPYESNFHLLRARVALQQREPKAASTAARRALEYDDSARGHLLLGHALLELGDRDGARAELRAAEAIDPNDAGLDELRAALSKESGPSGRTP